MSDVIKKSRAPRAAKRQFEALVRSGHISLNGLNWMVSVLDPFCDREVDLAPYPDGHAAKTLTQCVTETISFTLANNKDAHVFFLPISPMFRSASGGPNFAGTLHSAVFNCTSGLVQGIAGGSAKLMAGWNVVTCATGSDWRGDATATGPGDAAAWTGIQTITFPYTSASNPHRLLGSAIECVCTTPVTTMGGSIVCYRMPNAPKECHLTKDVQVTVMSSKGTVSPSAVVDYYTAYPAKIGTLPCGTQAEAALCPGSKTWNVSDGVYQVITQNSEELPFVSMRPKLGGFAKEPSYSELGADSSNPYAYLPTGFCGVTPYAPVTSAELHGTVHHHPFDISGFVISNTTGNTQSFQFTTKYIIEIAPTNSDPVLLSLARVGGPRDKNVIDLYQNTIRYLPCSAQVDENPLGEWFDKVMSIASSSLPVIGSILSPFVPFAKPIGAGLGALAGNIGDYNKKQREKEEAANSRQPMKNQKAITLNPGGKQGKQ